jgi:hypothetical protein
MAPATARLNGSCGASLGEAGRRFVGAGGITQLYARHSAKPQVGRRSAAGKVDRRAVDKHVREKAAQPGRAAFFGRDYQPRCEIIGATMTTVTIAAMAPTTQIMPFKREEAAVFKLILSLYMDMPAKKLHKPPAGMPRKAAAYFLHLRVNTRIASQSERKYAQQ